ncbi:MAG TPA: type II toxin-antitoxin system prevent-host-death family antitoxin [Treponemataceae bacterium]|nr:type II toxin-antitoxin system prevent-host-death family antitoxin [Treponemataceae bacterium]
MMVTTYSEARRTLSSVLDRAKTDGSVLITRADGSVFRISPEQSGTSPFDGVETKLSLPPRLLSDVLSELKEERAGRYPVDNRGEKPASVNDA